MITLEGILARFLPRGGHRICRKCKRQIRKRHRWHQVRVGWFAPWYTCEHWDCNNPTADPKRILVPTGPELPFESVEKVIE